MYYIILYYIKFYYINIIIYIKIIKKIDTKFVGRRGQKRLSISKKFCDLAIEVHETMVQCYHVATISKHDTFR